MDVLTLPFLIRNNMLLLLIIQYFLFLCSLLNEYPSMEASLSLECQLGASVIKRAILSILEGNFVQIICSQVILDAFFLCNTRSPTLTVFFMTIYYCSSTKAPML